MTTVSVTQLAAVEPSLHHVGEDHEEGRKVREIVGKWTWNVGNVWESSGK